MAVKRVRHWIIAGGILAMILAFVLQFLEPLQLCCVDLPAYGKPRDEKAVEDLQAEVLRRSKGSFFSNLATLLLVAKARKYGPYIYGGDNRDDFTTLPSQQASAAVQANIDATVLIINRGILKPGTVKKWRLDARTLASQGVCECERFSGQFTASRGDACSGFLLDENHVVTASHCVPSDQWLGLRRFVFGFQVGQNGNTSLDFDENQVYKPTAVVYRSNPCDRRDPDLAVVLLDRPLRHIQPSRRATSTPKPNETVYIVGYPIGLPAKYAPEGKVRFNDPRAAHFVANTDGYDGNSGSPVFNTSNEIVGVHVRGVLTLAQLCGCWSSTWCPETGCKGEDITRIQELPAVLYDAQGKPIQQFPTNECDGKTMNPHTESQYERWLRKRYGALD